MVIEVILLHPEKALNSILIISFGMTVFLQPAINLLLLVSIIALQLLRESKHLFSAFTFMVDSSAQLANTPAPRLVKPEPIVTEDKRLHPLNAPSQIIVKLLGIDIVVIPLQA